MECRRKVGDLVRQFVSRSVSDIFYFGVFSAVQSCCGKDKTFAFLAMFRKKKVKLCFPLFLCKTLMKSEILSISTILTVLKCGMWVDFSLFMWSSTVAGALLKREYLHGWLILSSCFSVDKRGKAQLGCVCAVQSCRVSAGMWREVNRVFGGTEKETKTKEELSVENAVKENEEEIERGKLDGVNSIL